MVDQKEFVSNAQSQPDIKLEKEIKDYYKFLIEQKDKYSSMQKEEFYIQKQTHLREIEKIYSDLIERVERILK